MSNFDPSYRPTSEAEARELLNTMPRGHYYALNEGGRLKFLELHSWDEAMELAADEPTDQELFEMFNDPDSVPVAA